MNTMNPTRLASPGLSPNAPRRLPVLVSCAAALWLAACATTPPPTEQMAVSNAALAHAAGAGGGEWAPAEMGMAREKMVRANAALAAKDNDGALALAQQAQLDAQLAESKTEAIKARKAAEALQEASRALREEMARKATPQPK